MQRTHRGVALDTVFDENGTRRGTNVVLHFVVSSKDQIHSYINKIYNILTFIQGWNLLR